VIADSRDIWHQRHQGLLMVYRGASDIAAKAAMFVVTVAAARNLSREAFGQFALATTLGWLGSVAADLGIQVHLARSVAQHPERGQFLLRRWMPVRIVAGVIALMASLVAVRLFGFDSSAFLPMSLIALAYAVNGLSECVYYFFRGLGRTDLESSVTLFNRVAMAAASLLALWWRPTLTLLALAMLIPAAIALIAATIAAWTLSRSEADVSPVHERSLAAELRADVVPIGIGILLSALYFRVDVFLLERWSGTTSVALYNAVFRIVDALRLFPAAALAVALPSLCRAVDARPLVRIAAPLTAAAIGAAIVLGLMASQTVVALYGEPFENAVGPFRTLTLALPLMTLNYALTQQLIGWNGQRAYAVLCAGALAVNLLLNARLIPPLGMVGAAWATLWTEAFLTVGCGLALWRLVPASAPVPAAASPSTFESHR
jgi:O-antigen/teichoic acid export membrane protein